ncbi:MAG TPA: tyrosine-type recombinase/integrase [Vicinamibacterales bacterium]|jgi:site-specific recombinase XerD|nr:tyrosine-type recombinase/integrase [Vicinamibacterales bacterium]
MAKQAKSGARPKDRPKQEKNHEHLFVVEEIERYRAWSLATCVAGERAGALGVAALGTAGRRFELAALHNGDVREGLGGPEVYFPETKGGGSATVPVSAETFRALKVWTEGKAATAPLIPTEDGEFMHVATLWRLFRQSLVAAGISRKVGVHATRHAAGFLLLRATGDLTKVQKFLRHSSLATTAGWYTHVHMPDLRAGIEKAGL